MPALKVLVATLLCLLCLQFKLAAQTPGLIYKPATNGGNLVLDPNGDGYTSLTTAGFPGVNMDEGPKYSEIPYHPFPVFMNEPLSDLRTGASYGHTDFAPKVYDAKGTPIGSPLAAYLDGKNNFLFRVRLAGQSSASKGYSVLIDTDGIFGNTGTTNPGFEFEIVLCTNFDVRVYDYTDKTIAGGRVAWSGSVDQYSQKSIASSLGGGDADYFYDFYVPMAALKGSKGSITADTPLRMSAVTVTSAKSGIYGVASDIGGVDDTKYGGDVTKAWTDIITTFPASSPTQVQNGGFVSTCPTINGSLVSGTTIISGTTTESVGKTVIRVYAGTTTKTLIGQTTITDAPTYSVTVPAQFSGTSITVTAQGEGKYESSKICNTKIVACNFSLIPSLSFDANRTAATVSFTGQLSGTANLYTISTTGELTLYNSASFTNTSSASVLRVSGQNKIPDGDYVATIVVGGCESTISNHGCNREKVSVTPTISTNITDVTTQITGTATSGETVLFYVDGVQLPAYTTNSTGTFTITLTQTLKVGQKVHVSSSSSTTCAAVSLTKTVTGTTKTPVILGSYCGTTIPTAGTSTIVQGTLNEAAGTTVTLYARTSTQAAPGTQVGTGTVSSAGYWVINASLNSAAIPANFILTATAQATGKTVSAASATVTVGSQFAASSLAITASEASPVYEGSTSVKGTAPAGAIVTLLINGTPYVNADGAPITKEAVGGNWEFTGISPFELYPGAKLTVTARAATGGCESAPSAAVTVACKPASGTAITATFASAKFCPGSPAVINLSTSEPGTIYNVYKKDGTVFGSSVLGTGSAIVLQSYPLTADLNGIVLNVKTIKVGAPCQYMIGGDFVVSLYPTVPNEYTLSASVTSGCPNTSTVITVAAAEAGYSYQLINNETKEKIGTAITANSYGSLSFPSITVAKTTVYGVIIKSTGTGCVTENVNPKTITVTITGPNVSQAVATESSSVCVGGATKFSFLTESPYLYSLVDAAGVQVGTTITGNGTVQTLATGPLNTAGTYKFKIKVEANGGCSTFLTTQPSVTATNGTAVAISAGQDRRVCGSSTSMQGSDPAPGVGKWTQVSGPSSAIFADAATPSSSVSGLASGTYVFKWTVTATCSGTTVASDDVSITVNCPAEGSAGMTKFVADYVNGDVLAVISDDSDGGITAAYSKLSGSLPPGSAFNLVNNRLMLTVTDKASLVAGNYTFTMRTIDASGVASDVPLVVRMYSATAAPEPITPLPVEIAYFSGTWKNGYVDLTWMTASEIDNSMFIVERSLDGFSYEAIGSVSGQGNSTQFTKYTFQDRKPSSAVSYYRLRQIDFDGAYTLSKTICVRPGTVSKAVQLQAYPTPFTKELIVAFTTETAGAAELLLVDLQGRVLISRKAVMKAGVNDFMFQTEQLRPGLYVLKVVGISMDASVKVVKVQ